MKNLPVVLQRPSLMKLNCLVIEDEPLARKGIEEYIREIDFLHHVASCENALKSGPHLSEQKIDLIYLDIHMPKVSGIDFLKSIKNPPLTIFTTAFTDYAIEGYSMDIIDYLVKPIQLADLGERVERNLKAREKTA